MTELFIRVTDARRYQPYRLVNGLYKLDVGPSFATPREAVDYCKGQAPRPRLDDSAGPGGLASGDDRAEPEAPSASHTGSESVQGMREPVVCAGCGGPLPPVHRGQRRLTCSPACRERARYRRGAGQTGPDEDAQAVVLTPSRPSEAVIADPTPRVARGANPLSRATQGAGADLSPGVDPGSLNLGF